MVRYTLKQCYYFKAVADHDGISQVARALNLSQPTIAQALNKLENMYGFKLFIRHPSQGVELTPQGRELYLVVALEMLQQELLDKLSSGEIDAGITYDMGLQDITLKQQQIASLAPQIILSQDHPLAQTCSLLSVLLLISQALAQSSLTRDLEQECKSLFSTHCKT